MNASITDIARDHFAKRYKKSKRTRKISNAGFANISHNKKRVARKGTLQPIQFLLQYWPSKSFKVNDFHVIWKPINMRLPISAQ